MRLNPACGSYSRPKGVMGGPCLGCGRSQLEHAHTPEIVLTDGQLLELLQYCLNPMKRQTPEQTIIALQIAHQRLKDFMEVHEDHKRLVRELDVSLNGGGAAKQASLVDIVGQVTAQPWQMVRAADLKALLSLGVEICEREQAITESSFKEGDGVVRNYEARRDIAGFKRFIKMAKRMQR